MWREYFLRAQKTKCVKRNGCKTKRDWCRGEYWGVHQTVRWKTLSRTNKQWLRTCHSGGPWNEAALKEAAQNAQQKHYPEWHMGENGTWMWTCEILSTRLFSLALAFTDDYQNHFNVFFQELKSEEYKYSSFPSTDKIVWKQLIYCTARLQMIGVLATYFLHLWRQRRLGRSPMLASRHTAGNDWASVLGSWSTSCLKNTIRCSGSNAVVWTDLWNNNHGTVTQQPWLAEDDGHWTLNSTLDVGLPDSQTLTVFKLIEHINVKSPRAFCAYEMEIAHQGWAPSEKCEARCTEWAPNRKKNTKDMPGHSDTPSSPRLFVFSPPRLNTH